MVEVGSSKLLRSLQKIDRGVTKKYSMVDLINVIKAELRYHFKTTNVFVLMAGQDVPAGGSFEKSLCELAMKKSFVIAKDLRSFCKKHGIKNVPKTVKSIMGLPIQHRGDTFGGVVLEDRKHANTFGPEETVLVTTLINRLGAEVAIDRLAAQKSRLESEVRELVLFDSLTQLPNQRYFNLIVEMELKKAKGYSRQLSLAMIDLDRFRSLNARLGKKVGNDLLVHVARILKRNVRDTDFVARYGGEEFVILLPEALNEAAVNVADRVRIAVERAPFIIKGKGKKKVTISVGVVTYPSTAENLTALLEHADKALKKAKQLGRNQVVAL